MTELLSVKSLGVHFPIKKKWGKAQTYLHALTEVNLSIQPGKIVGIAGESGSGKSTLLKAILGLAPKTPESQIQFQEKLLNFDDKKQLKEFRHNVQMVFQNPYGSLNPKLRIQEALAEAAQAKGKLSAKSLQEKLDRLMHSVGLNPTALSRFPHAFSGGQRQRIAIARALATEPALLLADEATSSLDVSIQAHILDLFSSLRKNLDLSILFVSHSLGALAKICDRIVILYAGRIVEEGPTLAVLKNPLHPYTQSLIEALPIPNPRTEKSRPHTLLKGEPPSLINLPRGCAFHPRCPIAIEACKATPPSLHRFKTQSAACILAKDA